LTGGNGGLRLHAAASQQSRRRNRAQKIYRFTAVHDSVNQIRIAAKKFPPAGRGIVKN
jgi:hypothetical protein